MKKTLSEKKIARALFIIVMIVFAMAHEDSKRRNNHYNSSFSSFTLSEPKPVLLAEGKDSQPQEPGIPPSGK